MRKILRKIRDWIRETPRDSISFQFDEEKFVSKATRRLEKIALWRLKKKISQPTRLQT